MKPISVTLIGETRKICAAWCNENIRGHLENLGFT